MLCRLLCIHEHVWHTGLIKRNFKEKELASQQLQAREWSESGGSKPAVCCAALWWNLWHRAFWNQSAHIPRARSTSYVEQSGQASESSVRFFPGGLLQIVLSDVGHPAPGPPDLQGKLPKTEVTSRERWASALHFWFAFLSHLGGIWLLHLPLGPRFHGIEGRILFAEIKIRGT